MMKFCKYILTAFELQSFGKEAYSFQGRLKDFIIQCLNLQQLAKYIIMQSDQQSKKETVSVFEQMFKKTLNAPYFKPMTQNKLINQVKIQIDQINLDEEIDEHTFRIMPDFAKPEDSYIVYYKKGRFYIQQQSFFSCIVSRKHYFLQLVNNRLIVTKSDKVAQYFNFDTQQIQAVSKGSYFTLKVERCSKVFYFEPIEERAKENIVGDWVSLINKSIGVTPGKQKHFAYLPLKNADFYTQEHISYEQLQKQCNTLDILLFKSQLSVARVQKVFPDSQYDHVGVLLRNKKNELFIYESTSELGIGLTPWKDIIKFQWYNYTNKIAWRRININLSLQNIATVQAFVAKTLGKQLEQALDKFFLFSTNLKKLAKEQEKTTYSCTQLVARLYKELGLLEPEKSSALYFPVDFSQKTKLELKRQGVYLESERIIAFNR